jgi:Asp-tRNA(Asn)/Glu-tRNA(Gln) amidotransferase A subunit family amidase
VAYFSSCSSGESGDEEGMSQFFGPGQVDQTIRQAIQVCWMALPKDKKNVEEVERQIRRLVERALKDLREDGEAFKRPDA